MRGGATRSGWMLPREGERLEPLVSGVLLALAFPPMHAPPLPFLALVPLAVWLAGLDGGSLGRGAAARGSFLFGLTYFGVLLYWIPVALARVTWLAPLVFVGAVGGLATLTAGFGWVAHRGVHDLRAPLWLVLPVAWTALEWAQAHLPGTLAYPWLGLGTSLTGFPELVGIAELVGARGVGFWIAGVNGLVAAALLALRSGGRWPRFAVAAAVVASTPMAWGVWRARTLETRPAARVAVMQPRAPASVRAGATAEEDLLASLDLLAPLLADVPVDLVVLPEGTLSGFPEDDPTPGSLARLQALSREAGAPLLFGARGRDRAGAAPYNSVFAMEPQGLEGFRYDKRRLVPILERAPFGMDAGAWGLPYLGGLAVGGPARLFDGESAAYGVLVCYESAFPEASRRYRLDGADVLVNPTYDAWFGGGAWWTRTTALRQHPAHLVMRAIENRVGVVRSALGGASLFVDPVGRVHDAPSSREPAVRTATVHTSDVITLYARFGDVTGVGSAVGALLLALGGMWAGRGTGSRRPLQP